jgi:hypothetical protein
MDAISGLKQDDGDNNMNADGDGAMNPLLHSSRGEHAMEPAGLTALFDEFSIAVYEARFVGLLLLLLTSFLLYVINIAPYRNIFTGRSTSEKLHLMQQPLVMLSAFSHSSVLYF